MKHKNSKTRVKKILIIILALVIGSFIGYRFALAQSGNALKSIVEPGSMTTEASYIIFTDGSTVYARNGTTGEIEFSGTDASRVIKNAIDALTNGTIYVKQGTYIINRLTTNKSSTAITDRFPLYISGKKFKFIIDAGTKFKVGNGENAGIFYISSSEFTLEGAGVELDSNQANQTFNGLPWDNQDLYCIYAADSTVTLRDVYTHDAVTDNVAIGDSRAYIENLRTEEANYANLIISYGATVWINTLKSKNGYLELGGGAATQVQITNAEFEGSNVTDPVISVKDNSTLLLSNFKITNGKIQGDLVSGQNAYVSLTNGKITPGSMIFRFCSGKIIGIEQVGTNIADGLALEGSSKFLIESSSFKGNFKGISLASSGGVNSTDNLITNCIFDSDDAGGVIETDTNQSRNLVIGCNFQNENSPKITLLGNGSKAYHNTGYNLPQESVESASYIIYTDGSTIYAKNGTTGFIDYSGTNASYVIQSAINTFTSKGGLIFIKAGNYVLSSSITIDNTIYPLNIEGEGDETILYSNVSNDYAIKRGGTSGVSKFHKISHLKIYLSPDALGGIHLTYGSSYWDLEDLTIWGADSPTTSQYGILIDSEGEETVGSVSGWNRIVDCRFYQLGESIRLTTNANGQHIIDPIIRSPRNTGINIDNGVDTEVYGGRIEGTLGCTAIRINTSYNNFYGVDMELSNASTYGYNFTSYAEHNRVFGGRINIAGTYVINIGTDNKFIESSTYITENGGNATVSNNDWVVHGLATTPSVVTITPRSNATVWVNNRNATHFQVGVSSGTVTIDWHAEA